VHKEEQIRSGPCPFNQLEGQPGRTTIIEHHSGLRTDPSQKQGNDENYLASKLLDKKIDAY